MFGFGTDKRTKKLENLIQLSSRGDHEVMTRQTICMRNAVPGFYQDFEGIESFAELKLAIRPDQANALANKSVEIQNSLRNLPENTVAVELVYFMIEASLRRKAGHKWPTQRQVDLIDAIIENAEKSALENNRIVRSIISQSANESEKFLELIEVIASIISMQVGLSGLSKAEEIRQALLQNTFALGYMYGLVYGGLQGWDITQENEERYSDTFKLVCADLFGENGTELVLKALEVFSERQFSDGYAMGGQEFLNWADSKKQNRPLPDGLRQSLVK